MKSIVAAFLFFYAVRVFCADHEHKPERILEAIQDYSKIQNWEKVPPLYQQLFSRRESHLIDQGSPHYAIHFRLLSDRAYLSMPKDGKEFYLQFAEAAAKDLLEEYKRTTDLAVLEKIARKYRFTQAGTTAMAGLIERNNRLGFFGNSARLYDDFRLNFSKLDEIPMKHLYWGWMAYAAVERTGEATVLKDTLQARLKDKPFRWNERQTTPFEDLERFVADQAKRYAADRERSNASQSFRYRLDIDEDPTILWKIPDPEKAKESGIRSYDRYGQVTPETQLATLATFVDDRAHLLLSSPWGVSLFDAEGTLRWARHNSLANRRRVLAIDSLYTYTARETNEHLEISAFQTRSGVQRWVIPFTHNTTYSRPPIKSNTIASDGSLYFVLKVDETLKLVCIRQTLEKVAWSVDLTDWAYGLTEYRGGERDQNIQIAYRAGKLVVVGPFGEIFGIDTVAKRIDWRRIVPAREPNTYGRVEVVLDDKSVTVLSKRDELLTQFDLANGAERWKRPARGAHGFVGLSEGVLVLRGEGFVQLRDSKEGALLKEVQRDLAPIRGYLSAKAAYLVDKEGKLLRFSLRSGKLEKSFSFIENSEAGELFPIGTNDKLIAYQNAKGLFIFGKAKKP